MAFGEEYSSTLLVEINGKPLLPHLAAMLLEGYVDDSSNVPDLFVLRYSDENATFLEKASVHIGDPVTLSVQRSGPSGPIPLLTGEVTALETELGAEGAYTVVRGLDHSHRLLRGRRVEAYLQSTATDIARKVASRAGLKAGTIDAPGPVLEHVAQSGENDWDFLGRLAEEAGAVLHVSDGALHFTTATDATTGPSGEGGARRDPLVLERGVNLLALRGTVTSAEQVPDVEVRGWDIDGKRELVAVAPAETRRAVLDGVAPAALAQQFDSPRYVAPATVFDQQAQCNSAATALSAHLAGGFAELDGVARGNPRLRSGTAVSLVGVGKPFEGRYTLSSTCHEFSPATGYRTTFTVSHGSERSLYGLTSGATPRPGNPMAFPGVLNAVVTAVQDPADRGRVKVKFPLLSDGYESGWVRTVQLGAGAGRGAVVLPEVGDEVLVAFGQGSFQQPFVLGGLYNGQDLPDKPWGDHIGSTDGAIERRAFVSRTGMLVEFVETPGEERLTLSTHSGEQKVSLIQKGNAGLEILSEGPVTVTAKDRIDVTTTTGDVTLRGKNVTVEASSALALKGATVSAVGRTAAELKAPSVKVAADATAELSGAATTTIKGGLVRIN
ncbi:VgrG-related protein [Kocuria flava]|uniref:VgrG-related protein n=1 Tax=Kocuria flava TaxID=446860 RepID=UPI001FF255A9|nr:VgrG-related protein [Kocuria flava]MCJ8505888.1 VgrG-related protein [Kocuria flava]